MRCPKCFQQLNESVKQCQCDFTFDDVSSLNLEDWFAEVKQTLETAYQSASTPWQQSGKSGTFEDWTRLRIANLAPVVRSGTYLDIGCANGYLLECLVVWARLKGIELTPYGLDYSAELITLAQHRLQSSGNLYVANAWSWIPPQRFDYVRTELDYVPRNHRKAFVERLLAEMVAQDGRLIVSQYRSRQDDLSQGWIDQELESYGYQVIEIHSGFSGSGLELCRVAVLQV